MNKYWLCWLFNSASALNAPRKEAWSRTLTPPMKSKRLACSALLLSTALLLGCTSTERLPAPTNLSGNTTPPFNTKDASNKASTFPDNVQFGKNGIPYITNPFNPAEGLALSLIPDGLEEASTADAGSMTFVRLDEDNIIDNELVILVEGIEIGRPTFLEPSLFTPGKYEAMLTYSIVLSDGSLCYMDESTIVDITAATDLVEVVTAVISADEMPEEQRSIVESRTASTD